MFAFTIGYQGPISYRAISKTMKLVIVPVCKAVGKREPKILTNRYNFCSSNGSLNTVKTSIKEPSLILVSLKTDELSLGKQQELNCI